MLLLLTGCGCIPENCTMNNHVSGVTPQDFANNARLSGFYNALSTNVDRKGKAFISSIEG